jgi:chemotaxis protein MotB
MPLLEKNSGEALQANMNKIDLLSQLDAKAKALAIEQERLSKRHNDYKN